MANQLCNVLRDHEAFKPCMSKVDLSFYLESCKYDLCSDKSSVQRDRYLCSIISAYTLECANKGVLINWHNYTSSNPLDKSLDVLKAACDNSFSMQCKGGSSYTMCVPTESSCLDLNEKSLTTSAEKKNFDCLPGCSCPENEFFDYVKGELKCVPINMCSCKHPLTNKMYNSNERVNTLCSSWYLFTLLNLN
jgi:hypothetical protein